ncbi:hypothetical protein ACIRBX_30010 [Kitasatospora sp. NPDC096147]
MTGPHRTVACPGRRGRPAARCAVPTALRARPRILRQTDRRSA